MTRRRHRLRRHRLPLAMAGVLALAGIGTYAMAAQPSASASASTPVSASVSGSAAAPARIFDLCGFGRGTQWNPRSLSVGAHDLQGTPADRDVSAVRVAPGYRALLFDSPTATRPALTLTADRDLCGTPLNDRLRRIVVQRAAAPTTPPPTPTAGSRPKVWVLSDLSVPGGGTDKDDIVSMAALGTYADDFDIAEVSVGSTTVHIDCGAAYRYAHDAFASRIPALTKSSTCGKDYNSLKGTRPGTVGELVDAIRAGGLTVLNWAPMTETALAVRWIETHAPADLSKVRVVTHWTVSSPGYSGKYNCSKDRAACSYLHDMAAAGRIDLVEVGAAGQKFVDQAKGQCHVDNSIPDTGLGKYLRVKRKSDGTPDFSDGATFLLMETGGLAGYTTDGSAGTNFGKAYQQLCRDGAAVFDHFRANL
ncbi:hypothetical protein ACL02U_22875 [Streptomyces sp. MS06]|uniref:hypothetical protein n=1 Tax=Streptomyces sp. MS06 TaxID=3385974 RepID=UPI0039A09A4A